ncbi:MAG: hypothetical protein JSV91_09945 [Phycisphaerales bacterium]|nr:MAG: hypothetical protein JSV91_09945 [Phycisphaerales bacterium]
MLLVVLLALGVAVLLAALIAGRGVGGNWAIPGPAILSVIVAVAIALVGALAAVKAIYSRRGKGGPHSPAALSDLGLDHLPKAPKGFHRHFGKLPGIPGGGDVAHVLTGDLAGRALTAFQHYYMTMAGQTPVPVYHTVYVTEAPHWPATTIRRRNPIGGLLYRLGVKRGLILENEAFNLSMKVRSDSEDFALTLLGPEMQRFLLEDRTVIWRIGDGYVSMILTGRMRFDDVRAMLYRLQRFWELVPQELEAW